MERKKKKTTVKKSRMWSHPFLQHEFSEMQLITISKPLQKKKNKTKLAAAVQVLSTGLRFTFPSTTVITLAVEV